MRLYTTAFIFLLILSLPASSLAAPRSFNWDDDDSEDFRRSTRGIDRSSLDDDIVKKVPIPILFGVTYTDLVPDFGDARDGGDRSHEGQDIFAPEGTPIVSPTEAIVIRTGEGGSAGKYVYTANPGGETFRYMHLDYIADLKAGDKLSAGDFIGTVGNTGNAAGLPHHVHFELRDEDNEAQDPHPRLKGEFTLKEKISFLADIFKDIDDDDEYAEFLVTEFPTEFKEALNKKYKLPKAITDALDDKGVVSQATAEAKLKTLLASLPKALTLELKEGTQGPAVILLQLYLIYTTDGPARDKLAAAGPTGYYGTLTTAAVSEYQTTHKLAVTGVYDSKTRTHMTSNDDFVLALAK
jgi:hypothetical protein